MIKGNRVVLRPLVQDDVERQHEFNQDLELYGLDSRRPRISPYSQAQKIFETWTKFDDNIAPFAIDIEGKFIGTCVIKHIWDQNKNYEIGVTIGDRKYWGQGYGKEIIKLLLNYSFHYLGARRVEATTNHRNKRAIQCCKACGFIEEGHRRKVIWIEGEYVDLIDMAILFEEWLLLQSNAK